MRGELSSERTVYELPTTNYQLLLFQMRGELSSERTVYEEITGGLDFLPLGPSEVALELL